MTVVHALAVQWGRIAEERAYVGRAGSVGDEIGSSLIAARMVENIIRLGSGLIDQSQKMTAAAMQMAEKKVWAHRS